MSCISSYRLGPLIEDFGQIVIPTGVIEITRSPRNGEAAIGRVVKMFGEVLQDQRLIPYDSSGAMVRRTAVAGHERTRRQGSLDQERAGAAEPPELRRDRHLASRRHRDRRSDRAVQAAPAPGRGARLAIPEAVDRRAQVLRVTPYGATAIITAHEQPKIEDGTAVRVAAKMP